MTTALAIRDLHASDCHRNLGVETLALYSKLVTAVSRPSRRADGSNGQFARKLVRTDIELRAIAPIFIIAAVQTSFCSYNIVGQVSRTTGVYTRRISRESK